MGNADHNGPPSNRMEFLMSIKTKIAALALATLAAAGSIASSTPAQAGGGGGGPGVTWGIGAGLLGAAVVGTAIAANNDTNRVRRCGWVREFDQYGNYLGRYRTCNF
jgi:hypothetical protein